MIREFKLDDKDISILIYSMLYVKSHGMNVTATTEDSIETAMAKLTKVKKPRIKPRSAKQKGHNLQNWVCEKISSLLGIPWSNTDDSALIAGRSGSLNGTDVILRGEAYNRFFFDVECKNHESIALIPFWQQTQANTKEGREPLLVVKNKKLKEPLAIMSWAAFERVWKHL